MTPTADNLSVHERPSPNRGIARLGTGRTAFVGRTLRGPVNRPVLIKSFTEFERRFGGLWQPSRLAYAVEQFFGNGGAEAAIVRVVNGARPATLTLRAGDIVMRLRALSPGTREFLRASVDYDNVIDRAHFNLTVQRVRAHGGNHVEDQEIFANLSVNAADAAYALRALARSELIEVQGPLPPQRPDLTLEKSSGREPAYVSSGGDGDDGAPLTDYDLIGSRTERTGLFALESSDHFSFLCVPPPARTEDIGLPVLLVAERYCKERGALLVVDPPYAWHTADDALGALRGYPLRSENALMYFPRIIAHDKLRGHYESFAPCGAVAGMLARSDQMHPVWGESRPDDPVLRPGYRPVCLVPEDRRARLALRGVNTLQTVRSLGRFGASLRTLAAGSAVTQDWQSLAARRLALFIVKSIERGTRWTVGAEPGTEISQQVSAQVRDFFERLHESGAFGARRREESFYVVCDRRRGSPGEFHFLIGFAAARPRQFHGFRITHSAAGSRVLPASLNRATLAEFSPEELDWVDKLAIQLEPP